MSGAAWALWLPAAVSLVGAGLAYLGAWSGTRQRDTAGRREEWGRRFTAALEWTARDSERASRLGRCLLGELARSELASAEEMQLAKYLLAQESAYGTNAGPAKPPEAARLDQMRFVMDTGDNSTSEPADRGGES